MICTAVLDLHHANGFLRSLSAADAALIAPLLKPVSCRRGDRLGQEDHADACIFFPITLVASLSIGDGDCGLGLIGREGIIGWSHVLGVARPDLGASVLFDGGTALVLPATRLRTACFASPTLSLSLLRFVQAYAFQLSCLIHANGSATLRQRLSAWLLMLHDRIDGDSIRITHQCLADHLRVRRASITDHLHVLEGELALRCTRSTISVRDRRLLEHSAGLAYGRTEEAYRRAIGSIDKPAEHRNNTVADRWSLQPSEQPIARELDAIM